MAGKRKVKKGADESTSRDETGEGVGYVGTMTDEQREAEEDRLFDVLNVPDDYKPSVGVAPTFLSRDPDAVAADEEGDEGEEGAALGQTYSRVGSLSVEHPRARMASALHDRLKGHEPSSFTADELSAHAEKVGLSVDGSGANGAVVKADFVRAMDVLAGQYPRAASA